MSLIRFQCFLHNLAVFFSVFQNFLILKRGDQYLAGTNSLKMSELFGPSFCILILKT